MDVIDVRTRLPVLSIIDSPALALGGNDTAFRRSWSSNNITTIHMQLWFRCKYFLLLVPPTAKLEEATIFDHTNLSYQNHCKKKKKKLEQKQYCLSQPAKMPPGMLMVQQMNINP